MQGEAEWNQGQEDAGMKMKLDYKDHMAGK